MNMKRLLIVIGILVIAAMGWYLLSPLLDTSTLNESSPLDNSLDNTLTLEEQMNVMRDSRFEENNAMPEAANLLSEARFEAQAHNVSGKALLIEEGNNRIVRFEDFSTINGPNLHVYLASDLDGEDFVDLGQLRATDGNINYFIPQGTDTDRYNHVLIWCVPFGVLFSSASL